MVYVRNMTKSLIVQMYGGENYRFPPGKYVAFEDPERASWFESKLCRRPSPADGRMSSEFPLQVFTAKEPIAKPPPAEGETAAPPEDDVVAVVARHPEPAPPPDAPLEAILSTPPTPGHVNHNDEESKRSNAKKAMTGWPVENIIRVAKRHGVYKRGEDKPRIIERLLSIGFRP